MKVGYLESWGDITFTAAAQSGYNVLVMAFAKIDATIVDFFDGAFHPSPTPNALKNDIVNAKQEGATILFSVGGQNNTYKPMAANPSELATAIIAFADNYGFEGIDFDLEIDTDAAYLHSLCSSIKSLRPEFIISCAPQINQGEHGSDLFYVSTGAARPYEQALNAGLFNFVFVQAYNNQWPVLKGYNQSHIEFISAAFVNLKKITPEGTKIFIGEPANNNAAGFCLFNTHSDSSPQTYQAISEQYLSVVNDIQFGGFMVWSINHDRNNAYMFVKCVNLI